MPLVPPIPPLELVVEDEAPEPKVVVSTRSSALHPQAAITIHVAGIECRFIFSKQVRRGARNRVYPKAAAALPDEFLLSNAATSQQLEQEADDEIVHRDRRSTAFGA